VRWCFSRLREMLTKPLTRTDPNSRWAYYSIEVYIPKGPYSIYGGMEAKRLDEGLIPFVDICDLEPHGDIQSLIGEGNEVTFGLPLEFREYLAEAIKSTSMKHSVALTDAVSSIAGSSTRLFDTLLDIIGDITVLGSTSTAMINSVIEQRLRASGAIGKDTKMQAGQ
jgi:hypothetical protein